MSWFSTAVGVISKGIPIVLEILRTVKPDSQVEAIINALGLDKKFEGNQIYAIAKTVIQVAKQFELDDASPLLIEAELKKQYAKALGRGRGRGRGRGKGRGRSTGGAKMTKSKAIKT